MSRRDIATVFSNSFSASVNLNVVAASIPVNNIMYLIILYQSLLTSCSYVLLLYSMVKAILRLKVECIEVDKSRHTSFTLHIVLHHYLIGVAESMRN